CPLLELLELLDFAAVCFFGVEDSRLYIRDGTGDEEDDAPVVLEPCDRFSRSGGELEGGRVKKGSDPGGGGAIAGPGSPAPAPGACKSESPGPGGGGGSVRLLSAADPAAPVRFCQFAQPV